MKYSNCGYESPDNPDVLAVLEQAIKGEQCAIDVYSQIADITRNKDIVTYDIVSQILADEVEHEEDLQALYDDINEFVEEIKKNIH
jgi:bacterioferritin